MKVTPLSIPDVLLIEPRVLEDTRGFFYAVSIDKKYKNI